MLNIHSSADRFLYQVQEAGGIVASLAGAWGGGEEQWDQGWKGRQG